MGLNEHQRAAAHCAGRPLFIQAGAGTGKTFTLTKRLAWGLGEDSGPLIGGVENLLTITFTNKAAGELMSRVRAELRAQGLAQAALEIDAAWISTIHSMCRNLLGLHALETGFDADANMLSEEESAGLLGQAFDELLRERARDANVALLVERYSADGAYDVVADLVQTKLQLAPDGAAAFCPGPQPQKASVAVLQEVLARIEGAVAALREAGAPDTATCQRGFDKLCETVDLLHTAVLDAPAGAGVSQAWLFDVLERCPLTRGGNVKKQFKPLFADAYDALLSARVRARAGAAWELACAALSVAERLLERHRALKRSRGAIDMNDLLAETHRLLAHHPDIARSYQKRFASVMVDEFQDTDALQVQIVKKLAGEQLATLATVGDAQQSIYGFRGADLEVYREMRAEMRAKGAAEVALDTNYRSNPHVLAFVESIFSKPEFFGAEFLRVKPGPDNERLCPWHGSHDARVQVLLQAGCKAPDNPRRHTGVDALRRADAEAVAQRFEQFARNGAAFGDMAILMRSTSKAQVYLDALRARNIPCVVSGGSTFYTLPEVLALTDLLRVLENRDDDEALCELLASALFDVTDADLLALAVVNKQVLRPRPDAPAPRQTLFDALAFLCADGDAGACDALGLDPPSELLARAYRVLSRAFERLWTAPLSQVVAQVARESGLKATLRSEGVQGMAVQANIERFCDLLDEYEASSGAGVLGCAEHFRDMCKLAQRGTGARGKPGVMVAHERDAVQVMTIHASKGLEFPIVAVAEFEGSKRTRSNRAESLTEQGRSYLALPAGGGKEVGAYLDALAEDVSSFAAAKSTETFAAYARVLNAQRAREEEQRLLYVALTRARETLLLVVHDASFASSGKLAGGLFSDVAQALFEDGLPESGSQVMTSAGALVGFEMQEVPCADADAQQEGEAGERGAPGRVRVLEGLSAPVQVRTRIARPQAIESYSSLARRGAAPPEQAALRPRETPSETVSPIGSAFHALAQWLVQAAQPDADALEGRIAAMSRRYGLDAAQTQRLRAALDAWTASERYAAVRSFPELHAEYAFCVSKDGAVLEGYIDLLCLDRAAGRALVVDYKTGTSGEVGQLRERYQLQAQCYAHAVMVSGLAKHVELAFVRPEVGMEEVRYEFSA